MLSIRPKNLFDFYYVNRWSFSSKRPVFLSLQEFERFSSISKVHFCCCAMGVSVFTFHGLMHYFLFWHSLSNHFLQDSGWRWEFLVFLRGRDAFAADVIMSVNNSMADSTPCLFDKNLMTMKFFTFSFTLTDLRALENLDLLLFCHPNFDMILFHL